MAGKIIVIGDVILDVYHFCHNRENPESSAPCYTITRTEYKPGGAGNVAANLARLGSECELISVVGNDSDSSVLENILDEYMIMHLLIKDNKRNTIVKERYHSASDGRYHFRADFEKREEIANNHIEGIAGKIEENSLVLISDYNKGVITSSLMETLKSKKVRIIADTKPSHRDYFFGIDYIKPNAKEVKEMTGIDDEIVAGEKLAQILKTNVILTRGKEGLTYFGRNNEWMNFKPQVSPDKVLDVTGAGDSVIATFTHFLNKGYEISKCLELANKAGGISVQYPGCYQVSEKELL
jgi:rfaE bifunctional protein kinase chain/domain